MKNTKEIGNIKTTEKQETMPVGASIARPCSKERAIVDVGAILIARKPLKNCLKDKQAGITLIALVITIIILLILSTVTINLTLGEHGIFSTAKRAGEKYKISEYLEKIELARISAASGNMGEITIEDIVEQIYKDKVVPEGSITIGDDYAVMATPEGDNFIITKEDAEYVEGSKEDLLQPVTSIEIEPESIELKIGEKKTITAKINPEKAYSKKISWINGNEDIIKIGEQKINADKTVSIEITGVSGGSTSVTAKSVHGENGKEIIGNCTINVMKEKVYLYNLGDECTDITGGWTSKWEDATMGAGGSIWTSGTAKFNKNSDNMEIIATANAQGLFGFIISTVNKIDLTNYTTLNIKYGDLSVSNKSVEGPRFSGGLSRNGYDYYYDINETNWLGYRGSAVKRYTGYEPYYHVDFSRKVLSINISDVNEAVFISPISAVNAAEKTTSATSYSGIVYQVWLE